MCLNQGGKVSEELQWWQYSIILSGFECQFFILSSWMSWIGKMAKSLFIFLLCTKSNGNSIEFFLSTWTWSRFKSSQARTLHLAQNCRNKKEEEKGKLIPQNKFEVLASKVVRCEVRRKGGEHIRWQETEEKEKKEV